MSCTSYVTSLQFALKEHKASVTCIKVKKNNQECVSSSVDGSCIIWDLKSYTRVMCLFESTMFKRVVYHPDES